MPKTYIIFICQVDFKKAGEKKKKNFRDADTLGNPWNTRELNF